MKAIDLSRLSTKYSPEDMRDLRSLYVGIERIEALLDKEERIPLPLIFSNELIRRSRYYQAFQTTLQVPRSIINYDAYRVTGSKDVFESLEDMGCVILLNHLHIEICDIKSLKGAPAYVMGEFSISDCGMLQDLEGGPLVTGYCGIVNVPIKSLKGSPLVVRGEFYLANLNNLKSLDGMPKIVTGDVVIDNCKHLKNITEEDIRKRCHVVGAVLIDEPQTQS